MATAAGPCGNGTASSTDTVITCTYASTGSEDTFTVPEGGWYGHGADWFVGIWRVEA